MTPFHFRMQMIESLHSSFSRLYFISLFPPETRRPPWLDPDPSPADLENARKALLYEHNPNQPHSLDQLRAERLGLSSRPLHRRSHTAPAHMRTEKVSVSKVRNNEVFRKPTFGLRAYDIVKETVFLCAVYYCAGKADPSKDRWNPKLKLGVTTHFKR